MAGIVQVVGGVFYKRHPEVQILLFRKTHGSLAGFFEFPGGKVEPFEGPENALQREIAEELGVSVNVQQKIGSNIFEVSGRKIELILYLVETNSEQSFKLTDHDQTYWLSEKEEFFLPKVAPGDLPLLPKIFSLLKLRS